jgi:hypothetical protein
VLGTQVYKRLELHGDGRKRRQDSLPEHLRYQDLGCEISPTCLRCPLERCAFDTSGGVQQTSLAMRNRSVRRFREQGAPIDAIAIRYGLSRRTVLRILNPKSPRRARDPARFNPSN